MEHIIGNIREHLDERGYRDVLAAEKALKNYRITRLESWLTRIQAELDRRFPSQAQTHLRCRKSDEDPQIFLVWEDGSNFNSIIWNFSSDYLVHIINGDMVTASHFYEGSKDARYVSEDLKPVLEFITQERNAFA